MSSSTSATTSTAAAAISVHQRSPGPEPGVGMVVGERVLFEPLGIGTVVGTVSGAVGDGAVVWEPTAVVGVVVLTPLGPTTPSGVSSPRACCGVGSKDTQPARDGHLFVGLQEMMLVEPSAQLPRFRSRRSCSRCVDRCWPPNPKDWFARGERVRPLAQWPRKRISNIPNRRVAVPTQER